MTSTPEEEKLDKEKGLDTWKKSKHDKKTEETKKDVSDNLSKAEKIAEWFVETYGEHPTKKEVVEFFQKENPEVYQDKSYEEILDIQKNGIKKEDGKYDTGLQHKDLHTWLTENVVRDTDDDKENNKEDRKTDKEDKKNTSDKDTKTDIEKKKQELFDQDDKKPENKDVAPVKKEKDENKKEITPDKEPTTWDAKKDAKEDQKTKKDVKAEDDQEDKKPKKEKKWWFWNKTKRVVAWPFKKTRQAVKFTGKVSRSLLQDIGRTAKVRWLPSYLLADLGTKEKEKRTWRKDRWAGYKKHRAWTKKSK